MLCKYNRIHYDYVHVHVIYFSINLLQDMEIVTLITIKGIQQPSVQIHKTVEKNSVNKNNIQY
jgi:hypothetical protein